MITTRMLRETNDIDADDDATSSALSRSALATVPFGWVTPTALRLAVPGRRRLRQSIVAQFCVIRSLKLASASVVVPYQYTLIVWSVVFGWLMFAELPDAYTIVGAAIIVAAGLYIFWREQVARAQDAGRAGGNAVTAQAPRSAALAGIGLMLARRVPVLAATTRSANGCSRPIRSGRCC